MQSSSPRFQLSRRSLLGGLAALPILSLPFMSGPSMAQEEPVEIPPPSKDLKETGSSAKAVLAGGCFWGVQGVFQHVKGVTRAVSGYAGGSAETATYDQSSRGDTGHAETVEVTYDPTVISFGKILQIYFSVAHNPTQLNFQGPDRGTQYRSTIFALNAAQADTAKAYIAELDALKKFDGPIVTTIEQFKGFYPAEQYHQDFLTLNPTWPYIVRNDLPKIDALASLFPSDYRADPVLVGELAAS
ncbi:MULTISPECIES: peptide-methionine (S)-S-oxide reductase MsrA [unclassified Devosia]|uniref:peptide-methionine (S)-S-oxide reductase MsrA n=1 Tax=unclassified Devosia TaxID=196773 RepID=UPI00071563D2|nr:MULTISPECIES: peptide-methionine (S)-S-oxide reductase MsrA [unclassified Devosia]KQN72895.1 methionine sulfoxide reductase A [Devosia sp. Leaf64]KQT51338.1 methionine sulfoxide reductase A [Devosia sp. Leaf420]